MMISALLSAVSAALIRNGKIPKEYGKVLNTITLVFGAAYLLIWFSEAVILRSRHP